MRDRRFRWRSGGGIWPQERGYWSPTLTVKDPQIPHLPLETAAGQGGYVDMAATFTGVQDSAAGLGVLRALTASLTGVETITAALERLVGLAAGAGGETAAAAAMGVLRGLAAIAEGATQSSADLTAGGGPAGGFWRTAWPEPVQVTGVDLVEEESMLLLMGLFHPVVLPFASPRGERIRAVQSKRLDDERMLATLVERLLAEQLDRVLENPDWEREEQILYEALFPVLVDLARKEAIRELRKLRRQIPR